MIEVFNTLEAVLFFIEILEDDHKDADYLKFEVLKLSDGRWRVGVLKEAQLEMNI